MTSVKQTNISYNRKRVLNSRTLQSRMLVYECCCYYCYGGTCLFQVTMPTVSSCPNTCWPLTVFWADTSGTQRCQDRLTEAEDLLTQNQDPSGKTGKDRVSWAAFAKTRQGGSFGLRRWCLATCLRYKWVGISLPGGGASCVGRQQWQSGSENQLWLLWYCDIITQHIWSSSPVPGTEQCISSTEVCVPLVVYNILGAISNELFKNFIPMSLL